MTGRLRLGILLAVLVLVTAGAATAVVTQAADPTPAPTGTKADRGWLGISIAALNDQLAHKLDVSQTTGIIVLRAMPESPAAKAGVQEKDIITSINGTATSTMDDLKQQIAGIKPNDSVQLVVERNGQSQTLTVTAGSTPTKIEKRLEIRGAPGLGVLPALPGFGLGDLKGILPSSEMFDHMLGGQFSYKDKDGNTVTVAITFGKVVSASDTSVTITPNDGSAQATYNITADTRIPGKGSDLKAGDNVSVITKNGSKDAVSVMGNALRLPKPRAPQGGETQGFFNIRPDRPERPAIFDRLPFNRAA